MYDYQLVENTIIDWFVNNREWVFSGIGGGIALAILSYVFEMPRRIKEFIKKRNYSTPSYRYNYSLSYFGVNFIITDKKMVNHYVSNYVNHPIRYIVGRMGSKEAYSVRCLVKDIHSAIKNDVNKNIIVLLGKVGMGKSAAMRYLFFKLYNKLKPFSIHLIYIPMRMVSSIDESMSQKNS